MEIPSSKHMLELAYRWPLQKAINREERHLDSARPFSTPSVISAEMVKADIYTCPFCAESDRSKHERELTLCHVNGSKHTDPFEAALAVTPDIRRRCGILNRALTY